MLLVQLDVLEDCEPRVNPPALATARRLVQILAAHAAQAPAILAADRVHGQRQQYLLADDGVQVNRLAVVGIQVGLAQLETATGFRLRLILALSVRGALLLFCSTG